MVKPVINEWGNRLKWWAAAGNKGLRNNEDYAEHGYLIRRFLIKDCAPTHKTSLSCTGLWSVGVTAAWMDPMESLL